VNSLLRPRQVIADPRYAMYLADGQDADIVDYLERFDRTPPERPSDRDDPPVPDPGGHADTRAEYARRAEAPPLGPSEWRRWDSNPRPPACKGR